MKILIIRFLCILFLTTAVLIANPVLFNYLGTGSNPKLTLQLSANGNNWVSDSIPSQQSGNIPWGSNSSNNWSAWNVKDQNGQYYGTITIEDVNGVPSETKYVRGNDGCYLEAVHLNYVSPDNYSLTVNAIHGYSSSSPFPDAPVATPALYPNSQEPIILSVSGSTIVNNKGIPILFKGLVRPSLEWNAQGQYLSVSDITNMKNWGANVIRLDMNQGYWLNSAPISTNGSYKQIIDAIIYYATQNNMAVILDLHWLAANSGQQPMANQDSITFWQQLADQYKNFGTVIFELYNEPYGISQNVWLSGGNGCVGYQQLYAAVRGKGANNLCVINGLDYAYDISFVNDNFRVIGNNIIYGSHPYNQKGQYGYTGEGGTFAQNFAGVLGKYPIIFTEFGINDNSYFPTAYKSIYTNILSYANTNNISYTGFAWWVDSNPAFPALISDWQGTPLNGGILVHDDLQNNPGTSISQEIAKVAKKSTLWSWLSSFFNEVMPIHCQKRSAQNRSEASIRGYNFSQNAIRRLSKLASGDEMPGAFGAQRLNVSLTR